MGCDLAETVGEDSVRQPFSAVLHFSERMSIKKTQANNIFHVILQSIILIFGVLLHCLKILHIIIKKHSYEIQWKNN